MVGILHFFTCPWFFLPCLTNDMRTIISSQFDIQHGLATEGSEMVIDSKYSHKDDIRKDHCHESGKWVNETEKM
jgi:hypothetical protein